MKAVILLLLSVAFCELTCETGKVYVKICKQCKSWGSEESFEVYSGGQKVYTPTAFANNEYREMEVCLPASTNSQYQIKFKDSYGDSWTNGAYVKIESINGNTVFKNYMTESREEDFTFSLYNGVNKNDQWKLASSSVTGTWTQYNYDDNSWTTVTLGSVTAPVTGTQYFRKTFAGLANMAAYELSMNYRYGVVAYINGAEIYRDNMPEGVPSASTPASGSYSALEYRSTIRPGFEVANGQSVVAIELHFTAGTSQTTVDFNAFLGILASSVPEQSCVIFPYATNFTSTHPNIGNLFDFYKSTAASFAQTALPAMTTLEFGLVKPYINALRVFPSASPTSSINTFSLEGTNGSPSSETWSTIITAVNLVYESKVYSVSSGYFNSGLYSNYRLHLTSSPSTSNSYLYEMQPLICNFPIPTSIEYSQATYTFYAKYENIEIAPIVNEFTACTINPTPAAGLSFDAATCTLSGKVMTASTTQYTVTSIMNGQTYTGSFQLNIITCAGSMVNINRIYKTYAVNEGFILLDATTQTPVLTVAPSSGQINNSVEDHILCLTGQKYTITVTSTTAYWQSQSFLNVMGILEEGIYETMLRVKYDTNLGLPNAYTFNVLYSIDSMEEWKYQMGVVPANWYAKDDMSSWTQGAIAGNFPQSTNQIQLYKKTFSVTSVQDMVGVSISLKYQYGVLIYLNGHEAFRLGVTGDLTTSSTATTSQTAAAWRQITLPIKTMITTDSPTAIDYITTGTNTIAIALVAAGPAMTTSTFDCAVRLMGTESTSRIFDVTSSSMGIYGSYGSLHYFYYSYTMYQSTCANNYYQITFNNDRHEWISSISLKLYYTQSTQQPRQFVLKAKNAADTEWTTLKTVTGMSWSQAGQKNRIWIQNNKAYNQYRLENIATGITTACYWKLNQVDLRSDATTIAVPALTYEAATIFKDIEMAEVYPNSEYFTDFTVSPPLPTGITIDPNTGMISGTATAFMTATTYTISAKKYNGEATSATFSLSVELCHGGKSLITLVARTDSSPAQGSYKLYQGKGTSGTIVSQISQFMTASALNYADFCLPHGIYTLNILDTQTGWSNPAGYYLTVDVGAMKFDMGYVYNSPAPVSITKLISSYLPFQIEYEDWKIYKNTEAVASNWNTIDFDDSTWTVSKAADFGTSQAVTVYIRKEITLADISDYHALNIRMKYAGGVVAYFNGNKVARFNLQEDFTDMTESIEVHDSNIFSVFHVILSASGLVAGKNVMAFEVHRPMGQSSAEPIVFDATGVFAVNECSPVLDSVMDLDSSTYYTIGQLENFFDLTPVTWGYIVNTVGSFLEWSVENLEGTKFNSFAMQTVNYRTSLGFSIYGREVPHSETEEYLSLFAEVDLSVPARGRASWDVPVGAAGFRQLRWEIDDTASAAVQTSVYILQYCAATGTGSCPGVGNYPPVGEGQISPARCEYGFKGYSYRTCSNGVLGDVMTDHCTYKNPENLLYQQDRYILVLDTQISIPTPSYDNIITEFYLAENTFLPNGLTMDPTTGAITGKPTEEVALKSFTIYGKNPAGVTLTILNLSVRKGECKAEGNFPKTKVGEVAEYECALGGNYVGTQKRACLLGSRDGEWQKIQGTCFAVATIVLLVIIVIVIVVIAAFFVMRTTKKSKAVGGVKGKKSTKAGAPKKSGKSTVSSKAVKV